MVSFERDKGIGRDAFLLITSVGHRKKTFGFTRSDALPLGHYRHC